MYNADIFISNEFFFHLVCESQLDKHIRSNEGTMVEAQCKAQPFTFHVFRPQKCTMNANKTVELECNIQFWYKALLNLFLRRTKL